jgi:hypothetical protein
MNESLFDQNSHNKETSSVSPLLAGIIGNALQSSVSPQQQAAGLETKKCKNCGAARPAETNLQYCDYCGHQFY